MKRRVLTKQYKKKPDDKSSGYSLSSSTFHLKKLLWWLFFRAFNASSLNQTR